MRLLSLVGGIDPESLRADFRIIGDAAQIIVFEFVMFEITGAETRTLFHYHDGKTGRRQLACDDAAGCARSHDDEVNGLAGLEGAAGQGPWMLHTPQLARQDR